LCKTIWVADFQDLELADSTGTNQANRRIKLYEQVAKRGAEWNTKGNLGLVVGATQPEALSRVRELAPELWILAPGVGTQGGDLRIALNSGLRPDGFGMLVTVSRGISRQKDIRRAADGYRLAIQREVHLRRRNYIRVLFEIEIKEIHLANRR
jgi:uridine monophosphate synthetase